MRDGGKLVIVGTGEWGLLADQYFTYDSPYDVVAFAAERAYLASDVFEQRPAIALEDLERHHPPSEVTVFVAMSGTKMNALRARVFTSVVARGYRCATYVSSKAQVWRNARVGQNCLVAEFTSLHPFASVGDNVFLHTGNVVGHRAVVEDHCFVSSHVVVAGECHVGASCFLGLNVTMNDRTSVAAGSLVTSGSLVAHHLKQPDRVYQGSPATAIEGLRAQDVVL